MNVYPINEPCISIPYLTALHILRREKCRHYLPKQPPVKNFLHLRVCGQWLRSWFFNHLRLELYWKRDYIVKRFARIYPVYFLLLTIVVLINRNFNAVYLLQNYTLTHSLFFLFRSSGVAIMMKAHLLP
jgi:hypothetical protein